MYKIEENQTVEMTINLRKICADVPWSRKAVKAIRKFKQAIQKHFRERNKVVMSKELNNFIFARGDTKIPNRVRVRVTKEADSTNAEENVFKTDLVIVGSFKGLNEVIVDG